MRLLIVGQLNGQIGAATKIAIDKGAKVAHAGSVDQAVAALRDGHGADLLMVDVREPIGQLHAQLQTERIHVPIVACGIATELLWSVFDLDSDSHTRRVVCYLAAPIAPFSYIWVAKVASKYVPWINSIWSLDPPKE